VWPRRWVEVQLYSSMTATLEGGEWSAARPGRTSPFGNDPVPILQEAGWAPGPVWTGGKSRPHRDSIPDRQARSSVTIPTELPDPLIRCIRWGWGFSPTPRPPLPQERPGTHFTGGWVGPRAGLDGRKISSPPGFDSGPSSS